jgi:hypothetical protein
VLQVVVSRLNAGGVVALSGVLRSPLLAAFAVAALIAATGCGGSESGEPAPTDPALVAEIQAAAEQATGATLSEVEPPEGAADAGVAAVLTTGSDAQNGQRVVISIGAEDNPNRIDEDMKAALGELAGVDVNASGSALGWGTRTAKSPDDPVYLVYWAEAPTQEELAQLDRSGPLKAALAPYGFTDD